MRKNQYYENLIKTVLELSEKHVWEEAVREWEICDCEIDEDLSKSCVCGKEHLKYLFTIRNTENGNELYPIGSTCINKFGREDLDYEVSVYKDMFRLIHAVENRKYIELTSEYFSEKLLRYLYDHDVFKPNEYNDFNGKNDFDFLLMAFKKRNKHEISDKRKSKIKAIIRNAIIPFIDGKIKRIRGRIKSAPLCPKCGSKMVLRTARKGSNPGAEFWGCGNYPECKYTKSKE